MQASASGDLDESLERSMDRWRRMEDASKEQERQGETFEIFRGDNMEAVGKTNFGNWR